MIIIRGGWGERKKCTRTYVLCDGGGERKEKGLAVVALDRAARAREKVSVAQTVFGNAFLRHRRRCCRHRVIIAAFVVADHAVNVGKHSAPLATSYDFLRCFLRVRRVVSSRDRYPRAAGNIATVQDACTPCTPCSVRITRQWIPYLRGTYESPSRHTPASRAYLRGKAGRTWRFAVDYNSANDSALADLLLTRNLN